MSTPMPVTVRWLLRHPELHLADAGGSDDLSGEIDFVVTTELADPAQWLSGGELVLTTGIGLLDRTGAVVGRAGCDRYVQRLVDRGIVALGFGVGLTFDDIPQDLIDAAASARLPLIVVPRPTPFVAIARAVADRSAELQYRAQELAARAQPKMTRAAVSGGAVALLKELAAACDGAALLLDDDGRVTQSAPAGVTPAVMRAVGEQVRGHRTSSAVTIDGETAVVTQPIRVAGRTYGHLAVASRREPRPTDHVLIGHANSLLALDFDKPHRLGALAVRVNVAVFTLLLGDEPDGAQVQTLAVDAADGQGRVRVLVCRDLGADAERVADLLGARLAELRRPTFAVARPGGEVAVLLRGTDDEKTIGDLLGALPRSMRRHVRAGVSAGVPLTAVADAYRDAITVAGTALRGGPVADRTSAAGVSLVATTGGRAALDGVSRLLIDPLVAYDDEHGTALTESLRSYLENHGQWETAATDLGVHRHTLRARIAKVESELDVDLGSARVRAELLLALLTRM